MVDILDEYSFNVPLKKTSFESSFYSQDRGGQCPKLKLCLKCVAYGKQCNGCDGLCLDQKCSGTQCKKCVYLCARAPQKEEIIDYINGLDVDMKKTGKNKKNIELPNFIPAINKRLGFEFRWPAVSIPFYAFFDFTNNRLLTTDLHAFFNLSSETQIIINFYFKDDKIFKIFDMIKDGSFWSIVRALKNVAYWHTVCFSVFSISSGMDILINFKRQFWVGDQMRDLGLNVIQECLYSTLKKGLSARPDDVLEIIESKKIDFISQCGQLTGQIEDDVKREMNFIRKLKPHIKYLITGFGKKEIEIYNGLRPNMMFSNYAGQYKIKKEKEYNNYLKNMNK